MPVRVGHGRWQHRFMSLIKVTALLLLATTVLGSLYISIFLSDDIKVRALRLISQSVRTEISMSEPELDLLTEFPYASLRFKDVKCRGVAVALQPNTLFTARRVSLMFSVWDFLFGRIAFKKITLEEGTINLLRNNAGKANWEIFNVQDVPSDQARRAIFSIQRIDIQNFALFFTDQYLNNSAALHLKTFELSGNLEAEDPNLILEAALELDSMQLANGFRPPPAGYHLLASLEAKTEEKTYILKTCRISRSSNHLLTLSGHVKNTGLEGFLVQASGTLQLPRQKQLENYLPTKAVAWPSHLTLSGDVNINFRAEGLAGPQNSPMIHIDFALENGRILLSRQPERPVMYGVAKGSARWEGNSFKFWVPVLALSSQNGSRIRSSFRYDRQADNTGFVRIKGKMNAADLWPLVTGSTPTSARGMVNIAADIHFKDPGITSASGKAEFQNLNIPLWNGADSLELSQGFCLLRHNSVLVTIEEARIFGDNFRGHIAFNLKKGGPSSSEKTGESYLECERLNLTNLPDGFWSTPLVGNLFPAELLRLCPTSLRIVADQVIYRDINARNVEALLCQNSGLNWHARIDGTLCGERVTTASSLTYLPQQRLHIYTTGTISSSQTDCIMSGLRILFPQFTFPDLTSENLLLHFRHRSVISSETRATRQWHAALQAQSGSVSGSTWLNDLTEATAMPEWKKISFQNLHYEAWGDSSTSLEARAELRQRNISFRLIHSPRLRSLELELPEPLASRIKSQMPASLRGSEIRDEGGRLYVLLYTPQQSDDFSPRMFREHWQQRPSSIAEEVMELSHPFPYDCLPLRLSPSDSSLVRKKRRR